MSGRALAVRERRYRGFLIDVDHFKKFNDRYGHQAGDDCLRSIAQTIAKHARRPADVAARYSGEEFVLPLPDTDAVGREQVAESIRGDLVELAMAYDFNVPSRRVTVGIGGATATHRDARTLSSSLIENRRPGSIRRQESGT